MHGELTGWREEFPALARGAYLNSCSMGAMPLRAREALDEFSGDWLEHGAAAWGRWSELSKQVAGMVGRLIKAPPGTVVMHQNVSALTAVLASCYDFEGRRNRIIITDLDFPSLIYVWLEQRRRGAVVKVIESPDGRAPDVESLLESIDERTLMVPLSHVFFRSGAVADVKAVVEKAHQVGAKVCLDSYQAAGCLPFEAEALGVDFCMGGTAKWLCGGPGAAWLYVREDLIPKMRPAFCGWLSHARPHSFEVGAMDFAPSVERFSGGSPGVPSLFTARAGLEIILEAGIERIRKRSEHLTSRITDGALARGLETRSPIESRLRGGTVCLDFEGAEDCPSWLAERKIVADWRPGGGLRISPHFYNTEEECDLILDAVEEYRAAP